MKRTIATLSATVLLLSGTAVAQAQQGQQGNQPQAQQQQGQQGNQPQAQQGQGGTAQPGQQQGGQAGQGGQTQSGQTGQDGQAQAAATTDIGSLTCQQLLALPAPDAIAMLFWIDGYLAGKEGTTVWDARSFLDMRNQIIRVCTEQQTGEQLVLDAVGQGQ